VRPRRAGVPFPERGPSASYRPDSRPPSIFGLHQPGIATPQLDHVAFAAFDLRGELRDVLADWSARAEVLMREAAGALTVTLGLGAGVFAARTHPLALRVLPPFPGDALEREACDGDLCLQVCATTAQAARGGLEAFAHGGVAPRWRQDGRLLRAPPDRPLGTPRDVLGFRDGTGNPRRGRDLDRHVWVGRGERSWLRGGTILVVRRILVDLERWRALDLGAQERIIGRRRQSGAPHGRDGEFDALAFEDPALLAPDAHARLAAPQANGGAAMLRRSYSHDGGLLFLAFMRDPQRQYVPAQRRLAQHDALAPFLTHVGSAVFAVPPGARTGAILGGALLSAC
jgi:deferrochelatase/peroxidase EfeB